MDSGAVDWGLGRLWVGVFCRYLFCGTPCRTLVVKEADVPILNNRFYFLRHERHKITHLGKGRSRHNPIFTGWNWPKFEENHILCIETSLSPKVIPLSSCISLVFKPNKKFHIFTFLNIKHNCSSPLIDRDFGELLPGCA